MNANTKILAMPEGSPELRKPRVMIAGEFSAGKSRLINALLGRDVLPSKVTSTALPPIWLVYGERDPLVLGIDGAVSDLDMEQIDVENTAFCVISTHAPILKYVDLIDTPGNSDPKIPSVCWERMVKYADGLIWCTSAMQAWKQTEKATCADLPEDLLSHATLLITQADRMPDEKSAGKVERRVRRDAGKYFSTIMMGSMLNDDDVARVTERVMTLSSELPLRGANEEIVDELRGQDDHAVPVADANSQHEGWEDDAEDAKMTGPWTHEEDEFEFDNSAAAEASSDSERPESPDTVDASDDNPGLADLNDGEEEIAPSELAEDASALDLPEAEGESGSDDGQDARDTHEEPEAPTAEIGADADDAENVPEADGGDGRDDEDAELAATLLAAMTAQEAAAGSSVPDEPDKRPPQTSFGQPNCTVERMWRRITADADLADNERFIACIATLLEEVQELIKAQDVTALRRDVE